MAPRRETLGEKEEDWEFEEEELLSDPELLATEIVENPRMLSIFLRLATPKTAKALLNTKIPNDRGVAKATLYRWLNKLQRMKAVSSAKGLGRARYYRLTEQGHEILNIIKRIMKEVLRDKLLPPETLFKDLSKASSTHRDIFSTGPLYGYTRRREKPEYEALKEQLKGWRGLELSDFIKTVIETFGVDPIAVMRALNAHSLELNGKQYVLIHYKK